MIKKNCLNLNNNGTFCVSLNELQFMMWGLPGKYLWNGSLEKARWEIKYKTDNDLYILLPCHIWLYSKPKMIC